MLKDLIVKNRSYRGYDESREITREELMEFVDCARLSASSVNRQPFKYYLAYTKESTGKIQPLTGWARALPGKGLPYPGHRPTAFIVICQETEWDADLNRYRVDLGIAAQSMLLRATEKGLGGIMIGNFSPAKIAEALALPSHIVPMLIVAFGKPDETVVLTEAKAGESLNYYRDENDVHYVPKRKLEDITL
jgi:nitroreductase